MKRSGFLKALLGLAVAPSIIGEIEFPVPPVAVSGNASLFNSLNTLMPDYYRQLVLKYGHEDYRLLIDSIAQNPMPISFSHEFNHFEKSRK